jgi:hypothetical protein
MFASTSADVCERLQLPEPGMAGAFQHPAHQTSARFLKRRVRPAESPIGRLAILRNPQKP